MKKNITILGSTGSIGRQSLDVAKMHGISVFALTGGKNEKLLEEQVRAYRPRFCAASDPVAAKNLKIALADTDTVVLSGAGGIAEIAAMPEPDAVLNSIMGTAGLVPTLAAIDAGHDIAIANKETLVTAGTYVMRRAAEKGVSILPVDSEHSAIFQCINGRYHEVKKILLTCSGGPFFGKTKGELHDVSVDFALAHPTWRMGTKITIDCATLMNKGLELIEAMHLFGKSEDQIEIVIHRESMIHSMVEYTDNAVMAQMGVPDMRLCIQYALTYPDRLPSPVESLDLFEVGKLSFYRPDTETFESLKIARDCARRGGDRPAVMSAANEIAVDAFLHQKIYFDEIPQIVRMTLDAIGFCSDPGLDGLFAADAEARRKAGDFVTELVRKREIE